MGTEARLRIMQLLMTAEPKGMIVGDIQSEIDIPNSTLSHHLDKLKNENLVTVRREGTYLWYRANTDALKDLTRLPVRRMLHPQPCGRAKRFSFDFQVKRETYMSSENIKSIVQEKYGEAAKRAASGQASACCGSSPASAIDGCDPITANLYGENEAGSVPEAALRASLGCGNPTALAKLAPGEIVLDLGSGGGIDVLLSARRVGPTGKAYGLDMTDEMLALAEENKRKSGLDQRRISER